MSDRLSEITKGVGQTNIAPVTPYEAVVANTATAYPQDVFVKIPSIDQGRSLKGAVRWNPLVGPNGELIFPTKGDIAQVVRTQEGYYWITTFVPQVFPAAAPVIYTTLPVGGNFTGRQIIFQSAALQAQGLAWQLMWDGPATYPWLVIGGGAIQDYVATSSTTTSTTYAALTTPSSPGPTITLPLPGEYDIWSGAGAANNALSQEAWMSYDIGATAASDVDRVPFTAAAAMAKTIAVGTVKRKTFATSTTVLLAKYRVGGGTASFEFRYLRANPIRVG